MHNIYYKTITVCYGFHCQQTDNNKTNFAQRIYGEDYNTFREIRVPLLLFNVAGVYANHISILHSIKCMKDM
jgi:hypothetical protein